MSNLPGVSGSGFEWVITPTQAFPDLLAWQQDGCYQALLAISYFYASEIENWMKANAPWTDRTGNARQSLYANVDELVAEIVITFGHGVSYGKFLELRHMGAYAIISPAIDHFLPLIWADVRAVVA